MNTKVQYSPIIPTNSLFQYSPNISMKTMLPYSPNIPVYHNYAFNYLKFPIPFYASVTMKKMKYGYIIKEISDRDYQSLCLIISTVNEDISMFRDKLYIKGDVAKLLAYEEDNQTLETKCKVKIMIQGYKLSPEFKESLIWKIEEANLI